MSTLFQCSRSISVRSLLVESGSTGHFVAIVLLAIACQYTTSAALSVPVEQPVEIVRFPVQSICYFGFLSSCSSHNCCTESYRLVADYFSNAGNLVCWSCNISYWFGSRCVSKYRKRIDKDRNSSVDSFKLFSFSLLVIERILDASKITNRSPIGIKLRRTTSACRVHSTNQNTPVPPYIYIKARTVPLLKYVCGQFIQGRALVDFFLRPLRDSHTPSFGFFSTCVE